MSVYLPLRIVDIHWQAKNALRMARKYEAQLFVAKDEITELQKNLRGEPKHICPQTHVPIT